MNPLDLFTNALDVPLRKEQAQQLLAETTGKDRALFGLVLETGMDPKELSLLRWDDVFETEFAIKTYDKRLKRVRTVYAPKDIFAILTKFRGQNEELVFPYSDYILQQRCKELTQRALGKEYGWHALRLTYITLASASGIPLEIASENSGISPNMLFKYWKHTPVEIRKLMATKLV